MATANAINADTVGLVRYDGAGVFNADTVTQHAVLVGGATNAITSISLTNGQLAIGSTGADPTAATLTAGTGVTITNGAGSITLNAVGGGLTWSTVTVNANFTVNSGVVANKAGTLVMTLPAVSAVGDTVAITGINTALGWQIAQNAGNTIFFGTSTTTAGVGGSLASTNIHDTVMLVCVTANANWSVLNSVGNITVV
jgi:hypothetical protein